MLPSRKFSLVIEIMSHNSLLCFDFSHSWPYNKNPDCWRNRGFYFLFTHRNFYEADFVFSARVGQCVIFQQNILLLSVDTPARQRTLPGHAGIPDRSSYLSGYGSLCHRPLSTSESPRRLPAITGINPSVKRRRETLTGTNVVRAE